jgi:5-formyltetrahydrofolate cyclo-ligase
MNQDDAKAALRENMFAVAKEIPPDKRRSDSRKICAKLAGEPFFQNANAILFFAPLPNEVDIWPLLEAALNDGKIAALPRFDPQSQSYSAARVQNLRSEIVPGQFGIREPSAACAEISLHNLDLILAPGIAFDLRGHRLGRGKGFYDRLLAGAHGVKCGVAFDEQITNEVPVGKLDVRMDFILTPTRLTKAAG